MFIAVVISILCKLFMATISRHVFINIFQTELFSVVNFYHRLLEKNASFLVILKSPKVWKKLEKFGLGSFKFLVDFLSLSLDFIIDNLKQIVCN